MKNEEWRPVKGFPGYEVSNLGRLRSYRNNRWGLKETPHILKQTQDNKGYWHAHLGRRGLFLTHRLVAEAFHPNPDNLPCVLHKNSNPSCPHASNLKWGTHSENIKQGVQEGSVITAKAREGRREKLPTYVFQNKEGEVIVIKNISKWLVENNHNPRNSNLYHVIRGKRARACGLTPLFSVL